MRDLSHPSRRLLLAGAGSLLALPTAGRAQDEVIDLDWSDLIPDDDRFKQTLGVVRHEDLASGFDQPEATGVTRKWNGRIVRLPGFIVPLEHTDFRVTLFILVPYVGACVHVPPPPANQLVLVTPDRPYEMGQLWDPVLVTGMFGIAATSTDLADIGYALSAERIEPYEV